MNIYIFLTLFILWWLVIACVFMNKRTLFAFIYNIYLRIQNHLHSHFYQRVIKETEYSSHANSQSDSSYMTFKFLYRNTPFKGSCQQEKNIYIFIFKILHKTEFFLYNSYILHKNKNINTTIKCNFLIF
jgi:hypothetical protein